MFLTSFYTMREEQLTYSIIGCAMKVHSAFGAGFQELIYQRALAIEFRKQGLNFAREKEMIVHYDGASILSYHPVHPKNHSSDHMNYGLLP